MTTPSPLTEMNVLAMLQRFARAFTAGDGESAAACWHVPALVVSDGGTMAVGSIEEVAEFFGGAAGQYNAKGIYGTRPEIQRFTPVTRSIASVEVRWPYLDQGGAETGASERSTYIVRADENGDARICVAMMQGASE
jgi:hypothetical protein